MSPVERLALIVWLRAVVEMENLDRELPGFERHGEWIPHDRARSLSFAREKSAEARDELLSLDVPSSEAEAARRFARELDSEHAARELARLVEEATRTGELEALGSRVRRPLAVPLRPTPETSR